MHIETYIVAAFVGLIVLYCTKKKNYSNPGIFFDDKITTFYRQCDEILGPVASNDWAKQIYESAKETLKDNLKEYNRYKNGQRPKDDDFQYYADMFERKESWVRWHWAILFINHALHNVRRPVLQESDYYYRVKSDFAKYIHEIYERLTKNDDCFQSFVDAFPDEKTNYYI